MNFIIIIPNPVIIKLYLQVRRTVKQTMIVQTNCLNL